LVDTGEIDGSPMAQMRKPKLAEEPVPIVQDDLRALLQACGGRSFEDRRDTAILSVFVTLGSPS
jgi:site-specific recombinase XerC